MQLLPVHWTFLEKWGKCIHAFHSMCHGRIKLRIAALRHAIFLVTEAR